MIIRSRPLLRWRTASLILPAVFLIPLGMSSLRGLSHVVSCTRELRTPFTVFIENGNATAVTSKRIQVDAEDPCPGLSVELSARLKGENRIEFHVPITNTTSGTWRGSLGLDLGDVPVPLNVGRVGPGDTETAIVEVPLEEKARQVDGTLFVGP